MGHDHDFFVITASKYTGHMKQTLINYYKKKNMEGLTEE